MLNIKRITDAMTQAKLNKAQLCSKTGLARTTLDAILNGSDARISTIEALARVLNLSISELFDDTPAISVSGSHNQVVGHGTHGNVSVAADAVLAERVKSLEALLAEKERLISVLMSCKQTSAPCSHTQNM